MIKGIDVSHHNPTVDFAKAKSAGNISFVYVKATEGKTNRDPMFQTHMYNAMKAGLPVGAYHFARPYNKPEDEAKNFLDTISVFKYNLLPALDLEWAPKGMTGEQLYQWARKFVDIVKQKTGQQVMLYTGVWFIEKYPALKKLNDLPLWISIYGRSSVPINETGWADWVIWQFSEDDPVPGIGKCDADYVKDLNAIMLGGQAVTQNNSTLLKRGSTGELVKQLQAKLGIKADGVFGAQTEQAVKQWQQAHQLTPDGIVGPKTWAALFAPTPTKPAQPAPAAKPAPAPAKPTATTYRVMVDGKAILDSAVPDKLAAAVLDALKKHAKEISIKPR